MISYREKQLLATMKYMQDESLKLSEKLSEACAATERGELYNFETMDEPPVESFDELVNLAEEAGYDCYIRATDILTEKEIFDLEHRLDDIEKQFKSITKLHPNDYKFLMVAITLQLIRQSIQPALDFENLDLKKREGHTEAAKKIDPSKVEKKNIKAQKYVQKRNIDPTIGGKYYAPLADIINIKKGVPYDETAIPGVGGGKMHRFKTLGHDPALGYLFGTCNILTNTLTTSNMKTLHIERNGKLVNSSKARTSKMFYYSKERFLEKGGKYAVSAALAKQAYHIKTDQKSNEGIGLPFLQLLFDEKTIRSLCQDGLDYNLLDFAGTIAKQSGYAEMINFIIMALHRIFMAKERYDSLCESNCIRSKLDFESILHHEDLHNLIFANKLPDEIRTRKIIQVSNAVASAANIIYVSIVASMSGYTGNSKGVYKSLSKLDVGGILITLKHLLSDKHIITKVKDDFIKTALETDFQKKLNAAQELLEY